MLSIHIFQNRPRSVSVIMLSSSKTSRSRIFERISNFFDGRCWYTSGDPRLSRLVHIFLRSFLFNGIVVVVECGDTNPVRPTNQRIKAGWLENQFSSQPNSSVTSWGSQPAILLILQDNPIHVFRQRIWPSHELPLSQDFSI